MEREKMDQIIARGNDQVIARLTGCALSVNPMILVPE